MQKSVFQSVNRSQLGLKIIQNAPAVEGRAEHRGKLVTIINAPDSFLFSYSRQAVAIEEVNVDFPLLGLFT